MPLTETESKVFKLILRNATKALESITFGSTEIRVVYASGRVVSVPIKDAEAYGDEEWRKHLE